MSVISIWQGYRAWILWQAYRQECSRDPPGIPRFSCSVCPDHVRLSLSTDLELSSQTHRPTHDDENGSESVVPPIFHADSQPNLPSDAGDGTHPSDVREHEPVLPTTLDPSIPSTNLPHGRNS